MNAVETVVIAGVHHARLGVLLIVNHYMVMKIVLRQL